MPSSTEICGSCLCRHLPDWDLKRVSSSQREGDVWCELFCLHWRSRLMCSLCVCSRPGRAVRGAEGRGQRRITPTALGTCRWPERGDVERNVLLVLAPLPPLDGGEPLTSSHASSGRPAALLTPRLPQPQPASRGDPSPLAPPPPKKSAHGGRRVGGMPSGLQPRGIVQPLHQLLMQPHSTPIPVLLPHAQLAPAQTLQL
jgi:hypothetical protein